MNFALGEIQAFTILFSLINILSSAQQQEFKAYYIVGDNVNMQRDTSLMSDTLFKVNFGEEFQCRKINANWFEWTTGYAEGFVNSKFIVDEETFVRLAEKLEKKNGTTLYSLVKHYVKTGEVNKADSLSIQIINNYINKEFPVYEESCPLYGELAFNSIVYGNSEDINYLDKNIFNYCSQVITHSKDSLITGFALYVLAKYYILNKNYNNSKELILKCIRDYGEHLLLPTSCGYNAERKTSLIVNIKNLAFVLYHLNGVEFQQNLYEDISKICFDKSASTESKVISCDLRNKLYGQCWDNK